MTGEGQSRMEDYHLSVKRFLEEYANIQRRIEECRHLAEKIPIIRLALHERNEHGQMNRIPIVTLYQICFTTIDKIVQFENKIKQDIPDHAFGSAGNIQMVFVFCDFDFLEFGSGSSNRNLQTIHVDDCPEDDYREILEEVKTIVKRTTTTTNNELTS